MVLRHSKDDASSEVLPAERTEPAHVLVVDDESDLEILFRQMFRRELRKGEMTFTFLHNGADALALLEKEKRETGTLPFDMVLSDIRMPRMDGLTMLAHINRTYPLLKVVMVTAFGDMENIRKAMNGGAFDFISKPIQYQDLKRTIERTLAHVQELRELHRAREEKERAQATLVAELQKLNNLKDAFLANTSHELRTPLNGIIGIVESLITYGGEELGNKERHDLNLVLQSGKRLSALVEDILDFAKFKNDSYSIEPRPVNLHHFAEIALKLVTPLAAEKNLALVNDLPAQVPTIMADPDRLQQILLNLLGNAVKFTPSGSVLISAVPMENTLAIRVVDTGIGIPEEKQEQIFDAFQQAEGSSTRRYGGTGLGLSITKSLVSLHGGELTVSSELGKGATFQFTLPTCNEKPVAPEELTKIRTAWREEEQTFELPESDDSNRQGFRLLLVDDDPTNLEVLKRALRGFDLVTAENGFAALNHIAAADESQPFDLILLDVMMPDMDGFEVCRRIRDQFNSSELPVLLLTAKNQITDVVKGLESGANDYIIKPFALRELLARVNTLLHLRRLHVDLIQAQGAALENARAAGRADFATTVLHNIGNILSSIKVSCSHLLNRINHSKVNGFLIATDMLRENRDSMVNFLTEHEKGRQFPDYFIQLSESLAKENNTFAKELETMRKRIQLMEKSIEVQQRDAKDELVHLCLEELIEESLTVQSSSLRKHRIKVLRKFQGHQTILAHRTELIHTLVNLVKNSVEAMQDTNVRQLTLETGMDSDGRPFCKITDSGEGVEDLSKLFKFGETTKKDGHGFGLHGCLRAMEGMGGSLEAESDGLGKGATFTLTFPYSELETPGLSLHSSVPLTLQP